MSVLLGFFQFELNYQNEIASLIFLINKMMQDFNFLKLNQINTKVFSTSIIPIAGMRRKP